ncbi:putative leucine-rich repeat-containing protein DDB_G0290503 isoform X2 [Solea solea]|uniref:putative leucine-rich repeat-containing protein DDB_G0290503 isoform X2 n=1 Tax=Solea solea TaxID=90069 RepID=UPI00272C0E59|nr:putative leucine-rich repeat-containing protein DDB_G0290503 isoform X2 [Solea solea]
MSSCRKFQANIFNKSKCQNCFKPRESHLLNDKDSNQAKPISGGWLLLAPEGTDFDNPLHRTRKWQRRFFILYEHGLLHYVLDEMPGTLPQGTINMNQCSDVIDGEMRTGHKNSLCILTPEKEYFIRAECKDVINGWQEALAVYPSTNKQKKKRKVEPNLQEPGPAKVTVTSSSSSSGGSAESVPKSRASLWQNESQWSRTTIPHTDSTITTPDDVGTVRTGRKMRVESGYFSLEKTKSEPSSQSAQPQHVTLSSSAPSSSLGAPGPRYKPKTEPPTPPRQPSQDLLPSPGALPQSTIPSSQRPETLSVTGTKPTWEFSVGERSADTDGGGRVGRCDRQTCRDTGLTFHTELRPRTCTPGREEVAWLFGEERRLSQILRRFEEGQLVEQKDPSSHSEPSANTTTLIQRHGCSGRRDLLHKHPDLLNFKKGWMTKLYDDGVWKKHWFVLTDQSLRYYKDSVAEEASHLDGEIDLSTCYDVKTFPVQRNYGFQILCQDGAYTLSAMTSGIRRNWIQAIMKNVQPTVAPDITRSLSDEKIKTQMMLKPCLQVTVEQSLVPEGHRQPPGNQSSVLSSELCKTAVCEHKLEGCSETYDCFDSKMEQTEKPVKAQGDTVDLSSTTSSSSPGSTSSFQTSVSVAHPLSTTGRENVRRGIQLHSTSANNVPNTATVTVTSTLNNNVIPLSEIQEQGKKEAHHPTSSHHIDEDKDGRPSVVHEEIEQRWHQVETTPLREEKQVPITTVLGTSARLPAHELVVLLDKELGQKQTELDQLQKQNNILKEKLEDALGRELSAREGYVLQTTTPPSSPSHRVQWQHLHKLNQETQKHKQDLAPQQIQRSNRSNTNAQDAVDHHVADIQALQHELTFLMAQILASEQAMTRMHNTLEQEHSTEQKGEATTCVQLKDNEDRRRELEACLLERNQAHRHMREVQRLEERLQDVTARSSATEQSQTVKEECLSKEQHSVQGSHDGERQSLCGRLSQADMVQKEIENRVLKAGHQERALLRTRQNSEGNEYREKMLKLEKELTQKIDMVETLRESMHRVEEKCHLTSCCQELLNQIADTDCEVNELCKYPENEEAEYDTLQHSCERATLEFQKMSHFLGEKEEEIRQTKDIYERLVKHRERDLKEALIKMTLLSNSLEQTEQKLQAKEELLCQMSQRLSGKVEPCSHDKNLQSMLVVAEDHNAELEQLLNALQLGYADRHMERRQTPEQSKRGRLHTSPSSSPNTERTPKTEEPPDDKESQNKPHTNDPERFISIIHALESRLLAAEDRLRNMTHHLEEQRSSWVDDMTKTDLRRTKENNRYLGKEFCCGSTTQSSAANNHYMNALACVENSQRKVRAFLLGSHDAAVSQLRSLSAIEKDLFKASLHIQQGQMMQEHTAVVQNQTSEVPESALWKEMEIFETDDATSKNRSVNADATIFNTLMKAELVYSIQNLELCFEEKFNILKRELNEAFSNLYQREMALRAIIQASKSPDLRNIRKEVENRFFSSKQKLADIHPPDVAPYMEQIKMDAARDLADNTVGRHLAVRIVPFGDDSVELLQNAHANLAKELQRQAATLHKYAQEIESGVNHPGQVKMTPHHNLSSSLCLREARTHAQVAHAACRLQATHEQELGRCKQSSQNMDAVVQQHAHNISAIQEKYEAILQEGRLRFSQMVTTLQMEIQTLKSEICKRVNRLYQQQEHLALLEEHNEEHPEELKQLHQALTALDIMDIVADGQRRLEVLLIDVDTVKKRHKHHVKKLEEHIEQWICELQHNHRKEIGKLQSQHVSKMDSIGFLKERIQDLETEMNFMRLEMENNHLDGDVSSLREKDQRDFDSLKSTCERGFATMEETHQRVIEDLQRHHQREISKLMEERERLLAEETAATIAAIEAMKNAQKEKMEKSQRSHLSGLNSDIDELHLQYEEELQSIQRELDVLSEQYSQKCLENAHLAQALEAERQALRQCQRYNQELNADNQELNKQLTAEITQKRSRVTGETTLSSLTQGKDVYELEVLLRIKESEIQYLKQEIHSLKDELQSALRDKKYATDKYKDIYTELSIVKAKADFDISKLKKKLLTATEALGGRSVDEAVTSGYDIMKSKSNPDFIKKDKATTSKQLRRIRSKTVTAQVSWDS